MVVIVVAVVDHHGGLTRRYTTRIDIEKAGPDSMIVLI